MTYVEPAQNAKLEKFSPLKKPFVATWLRSKYVYIMFWIISSCDERL